MTFFKLFWSGNAQGYHNDGIRRPLLPSASFVFIQLRPIHSFNLFSITVSKYLTPETSSKPHIHVQHTVRRSHNGVRLKILRRSGDIPSMDYARGVKLTSIQTSKKMERYETVDVIHIPQSGLPLEIVTLPLMLPSDFGLISSGSYQYERHLTNVPDLLCGEYQDWRLYASTYRELVNLGNLDPDQKPKDRFQQFGPYLMYKFPKAARTVMPGWWNKHFLSAEGAEEVYGDAFIFKVKEPELGHERAVAKYENLDKSLINSAFKGKGISAKESLIWLSSQ